MARLGHPRQSRRLWWVLGAIAAVAVAASFGTPKAGCAGSPDDEPDPPAPEDSTREQALLHKTRDGGCAADAADAKIDAATAASAEAGGDLADASSAARTPDLGPDNPPVTEDCNTATKLAAIEPATFRPTSGSVARLGDHALRVEEPMMRGVVADDKSHSAELAFVFRGMSKGIAPLADGELRQQIGLKLRAQDTCNIVYVMWHIAPTPGVWVLIKSNPGMTTHEECGDRGYINLPPNAGVRAPLLAVDEPHTLRADLDGHSLRVSADGVEIWSATLPDQAFAFDGPVGVRSDNGAFDFELRIPGGGKPTAKGTNP